MSVAEALPKITKNEMVTIAAALVIGAGVALLIKKVMHTPCNCEETE